MAASSLFLAPLLIAASLTAGLIWCAKKKKEPRPKTATQTSKKDVEEPKKLVEEAPKKEVQKPEKKKKIVRKKPKKNIVREEPQKAEPESKLESNPDRKAVEVPAPLVPKKPKKLRPTNAECLRMSRQLYGRQISVVYVIGDIEHYQFWKSVAQDHGFSIITERYLCAKAKSKRKKAKPLCEDRGAKHIPQAILNEAITKILERGSSRILFLGYPCDERSSVEAIEYNKTFAQSLMVVYLGNVEKKRPHIRDRIFCRHEKEVVNREFIGHGDWDNQNIHIMRANPEFRSFDEGARAQKEFTQLLEELIAREKEEKLPTEVKVNFGDSLLLDEVDEVDGMDESDDEAIYKKDEPKDEDEEKNVPTPEEEKKSGKQEAAKTAGTQKSESNESNKSAKPASQKASPEKTSSAKDKSKKGEKSKSRKAAKTKEAEKADELVQEAVTQSWTSKKTEANDSVPSPDKQPTPSSH